jgi:DNA polymerase III alpha subunit (gram-positive type)
MNDYIYIATDIESDGPVPGKHSMISFASVAFTEKKGIIAEFSRNLFPLPEAEQDSQTMEWWKGFPEQWQLTQTDQVNALEGSSDFLSWLNHFSPKELIFVSDYISFDMPFIKWYLYHFTNSDPFGNQQLDLMSFASALIKKPQPEFKLRNIPERWTEGTNHDHTSLSDAKAHAVMCLRMFSENNSRT